ncbi:response regulator, partial [Serratia quinivorans]
MHCLATVATLAQARALLADAEVSIDLVLLDIYMPQENGLALLPGLRELGEKTDVIIISSASDVDTVQRALHYGVVDSLIKPFQFGRFKEALNTYQQQSQILAQREFSQGDVASLLRRQPASTEGKKLPKGLTSITLSTVCEWIEQQ